MNDPDTAKVARDNLGEELKSTHVFQDAPDARQSERIDHPVSRFRPTYRALTENEKALHARMKSLAAAMEHVYYAVDAPGGHRYMALAMTALEESVMWAVKGLTS